MENDKIIFSISRSEVQSFAKGLINRELTPDELSSSASGIRFGLNNDLWVIVQTAIDHSIKERVISSIDEALTLLDDNHRFLLNQVEAEENATFEDALDDLLTQSNIEVDLHGDSLTTYANRIKELADIDSGIFNYKIGDLVWWTDPDNDLASGEYTIVGINADPKDHIYIDTIISISNKTTETEVVSGELRKVVIAPC